MNKFDFVTEGIRKNEEMLRKISEEDVINIENTMNEITREIRKKEDNAAAMEFTKVICGILKENGVLVVARKYVYNRQFNKTFDILSENYGVTIEELDFSQHDKEFADKIEELQSEVEKYRKAFDDAKKERDCQIAEYQKKIDELENHHKFSMMQIGDVLMGFLGVTHEIVDKPMDFEKVLQELIDKDKTELEKARNTINQIDDILEKLFGVRHDVGKPDEFEKILSDTAKYNVAIFLPTEPIKVADMLINASKKRTNCMTGKEYDKYIFEKWQLRQIAEHLLVYCNHNGELEE